MSSTLPDLSGTLSEITVPPKVMMRASTLPSLSVYTSTCVPSGILPKGCLLTLVLALAPTVTAHINKHSNIPRIDLEKPADVVFIDLFSPILDSPGIDNLRSCHPEALFLREGSPGMIRTSMHANGSSAYNPDFGWRSHTGGN